MDSRTLPPTPPVVQKGDRLLYETILGNIRYAMVVGTAVESNGRPVFDAMVLDGEMAGKVVWGYVDQVIAIEDREVPMVVTFRTGGGIVLDRINVQATHDAQAIHRARALAIAAAQLNGCAIPDTNNPSVSVDLNALGRP